MALTAPQVNSRYGALGCGASFSHLQAYADEQCFRYNQRKLTDKERFLEVCSTVANRRLTWNELTDQPHGERA